MSAFTDSFGGNLGGFANRRFSPYLDDHPLLDALDDDAQRAASIIALALVVHAALFFVLSANFVVPDLLPDEPDIVPVQIVTYQEPMAEPDPAPAPEINQPAVPAPSVAPRPKPQTAPQPAPQPVPEPIPEAVPPPPPPEPEPEPIITPPPPPEILAQPVVEPEPDPIPAPELVFEPVPEPEPEPEPIIEIFEPLPVPVPEPEPEPAPEPLPPIVEIFEPEPEPEPMPEPIPEPEPEPEPEPVPELLAVPDLAPLEVRPLPGIAAPTDLPDIVVLPDPEPIPEPEPEPEPAPAPPAEPEIIVVPPTILASPDAPDTADEAERAVTEDEADPFLDLLRREKPLGEDTPAPVQPQSSPRNPLAGPLTGGGNVGTPPTAGTRRAGPGTSGWTLAPGSYGNSPGAGYEGLNLDMRCREAGKTHLDCPEYLKTFEGRDAQGFEDVRLFIPRGTDRGPGSSAGTGRMTGSRAANPQVAGGTNPWALGIGNNSVNAGGPSTTILDDGPEVDFSREFLSNPVRDPDRGGRLRDLILPEDDQDDDAFDVDELILPEP